MDEATLLQTIRDARIIAVVRIPEREALLDCAIAAAKGGIKVIALPAVVPDVTEILAELEEREGLIVGIADVVTQEQVSLAMAGGAQFIISPICDREVVQMCQNRGLIMIGGAATPAEVVRASNRFPHLIAVFPAGALGGPTYMDLLVKQLPEIPLVASGGVDVDTGPEYLEAGAAGIIVDSGLFPQERDPSALEVITTRARMLVEVCNEVASHHAAAGGSGSGGGDG